MPFAVSRKVNADFSFGGHKLMDCGTLFALDKTNAKPLHIQIEESILQKLESKEWAPGKLIPSENELSHIYGVSRTTVRNVITKLVQEGLLFRIPGKGTYVAEPKIVAHSLSYAGIREQLEQMGYEVTTQLISLDLETADQKILQYFPGLEAPYFYVVRRLRILKGEPLSIHISYLPQSYCPGIDRYDLSSEQLCTVLSQAYGLNRAKAVETLESVAAKPAEASLLNIFPGQPLLLLQDQILDADGRTFEYSKVIFRGEKIKITMEI